MGWRYVLHFQKSKKDRNRLGRDRELLQWPRTVDSPGPIVRQGRPSDLDKQARRPNLYAVHTRFSDGRGAIIPGPGSEARRERLIGPQFFSYVVPAHRILGKR